MLCRVCVSPSIKVFECTPSRGVDKKCCRNLLDCVSNSYTGVSFKVACKGHTHPVVRSSWDTSVNGGCVMMFSPHRFC